MNAEFSQSTIPHPFLRSLTLPAPIRDRTTSLPTELLSTILELSYAGILGTSWDHLQALPRVRFRAFLCRVCRRWCSVLGVETELVARGIDEMYRLLEALEEVPGRQESLRKLVLAPQGDTGTEGDWLRDVGESPTSRSGTSVKTRGKRWRMARCCGGTSWRKRCRDII